MYRQTNPITGQQVATRGFQDTDGSISAALNNGKGAGTFYGNQQLALTTNQVSGPNDYQPGFKLDIGYKFDNGASISLDWTYLTQVRLFATATSLPFNGNIGQDGANSFLFSPVYGFPNDYAGAFGVNAGGQLKLPIGNPQAAYGIWTAASIETIEFVQKFQQYDITYRDSVFETENYRLSSTPTGARFAWIWEKFQWRTSDLNLSGQGGPLDTAIYSNIESNRMYGAFAGFSQECYLGHGFAVSVDLQAAMLLDVVRERQQYTTGARDGFPQVTAESKRTQTQWNPVPGSQRQHQPRRWYPLPSVQVRLGYNAMAFFNTVSALPRPIDFNYGCADGPRISPRSACSTA